MHAGRITVLALLALVVCAMALVPQAAYADSQVETKTDYIFKLFPQKQTTYKSLGVVKKPVSRLYASHKAIYAGASRIAGIAGALTPFIPIPELKKVGTVVTTGATVIYKIAGYCMKSLGKYKMGTRLCSEVRWKWVQTKRMPYQLSMRVYNWYEYCGKKISEKTCRTKTVHFGYGEWW